MNRTFSLSLSLGLTVALTAGPLLQVVRSERLLLPWAGKYLFSRPQFDPASNQPKCSATAPSNAKTTTPDKRPTKQTGLLAVCVRQQTTGSNTQRRGPAAEDWGTESEWPQDGGPAPEGVPVTFALSDSRLGEIVAPLTVMTDAQGLAQVKFNAAQRRYKGKYSVTACDPANLTDCDQATFDLEVVGKSSALLKVLIGVAIVGVIIGVTLPKDKDQNNSISPLPPPIVL